MIHTAYRQDDRTTTLDGARAVAEAALDIEARLVHLSTDVVFDGEKDGSYREEDEPRPITDYGRAKADAERGGGRPSGCSHSAHLTAVRRRATRTAGAPCHGPPGRFFCDEIRSPTHVGDLATALLELAQLDLSGVLHVAGADSVDRLELARLLVAARGGDPSRLRGATGTRSRLVRPRNCAPSSTRARSLLTTELRGARAVLAPRR